MDDYESAGELVGAEGIVSEPLNKVQQDALRRYRGPAWIGRATILTLVFSAATIAYGAYRQPVNHLPDSSQSTSHVDTVSRADVGVGNLPISVSSQYLLTDGVPWHSYQYGATNGHVYLAQLKQNVNEWPTIVLSQLQTSTGAPLAHTIKPAGKIELVPPISPTSGVKSTATGDWNVHSWRMWCTQDWVVVDVKWAISNRSSAVDQLYAFYIPTGKYGMFRTLGNTGVLNQPFSVTAGAGRIVLTRTFTTITNKTKTSVTNPIEVDILGGTNPLQPVVSTRIFANVAPLISPVVTQDGVVYQTSHASAASFAPVGFNRMTWDGHQNRLAIAPGMGDEPKMLAGVQGNLYVMSTSAEPDGPGQLLLMSQVVAAPSTMTLSTWPLPSKVNWLGIVEGTLLWTQQVHGQWYLIVAGVN